MPINALKPCYEPDKYLAFLGRITPEKGPEAAIRLAKAAGRPLRIAAKIPRAENQYFREKIEPLIDGGDVEFVGEVNDAEKQEFLGKAAGLLFPISWPEPFGLVMIEAMACGTPVIATRYGSVPEVVNDGVSGFVVGSEQEALAAIQRILPLIAGGYALSSSGASRPAEWLKITKGSIPNSCKSPGRAPQIIGKSLLRMSPRKLSQWTGLPRAPG